eukprot:c33083_g1_i1 orf=404-1102(-)
MACTLTHAVAITAGPTSAAASPSAKKPSCCSVKLHTSSLGRPVRAFSAASGNGAQQRGGGGEQLQRQSLQQSRRPLDSSLLLLDSWDPFSRGGLRQMMDTVDRLFLEDVPPARGANVSRGRAPRAAGVRAPWDVVEDEEGFHIRVDMPGFAKEDVKVAIEDGVLVVSGERDASKEDPRWAAKSYSKFNTRLALPDNVHFDKINAELKNGVLFVAVPKIKPEDRKQVINIEIA